ncbi:hypothetical protein J2Y48_005023 [Mycoplana sp. BE70]|uniref:hypothetical protein n=1 Tax=Mycoplana sp. BE70 TaxID=2817775 RepID=UPI0028623B6D|nr:hypothetical protein [Mycoplana sp. BE70]MDR6759705.1 hypothetical protein [Mycoplana sp. BE70]
MKDGDGYPAASIKQSLAALQDANNGTRATKKGRGENAPTFLTNRYSTQCQYIRGQSQIAIAAFASGRSVPALISDTDACISSHCVRNKLSFRN